MWQYRILETGFFYVDGGAMFGATPKRAWKRKYFSDEDNCCQLAMNCVLLWNENRRLLIDTGVGTKELGNLSYYRFSSGPTIQALLKQQGLDPEDITDVILSHLHFDHCGGCTYRNGQGVLSLSFSKALHHVSKRQWENYRHPSLLEKNSFRRDDLLPVEKAGLLNLIDQDTELYSGLKLTICDGHTPGQLVPQFISGGNTIFVPGDVIPTKAHLSDEWISAYDLYPLESLAAKQSLKQKMKETSSIIIFYHDAHKPSYSV